MPMDLSSYHSKPEDEDSDAEPVLPPPHVAFPVMCHDPSQASVSTLAKPNKRQKPESPKKTTFVDANMYTKAVVRATPFVLTLRLHDLMRFMDENTGLHHVQIILHIVTDHEITYNVTADGKQLMYTVKPKTVAARSFVDPSHMNFNYAPNQAIVQNFHNNPGTEEFTYTITLPEAVGSNCISNRSVYWKVQITDTSGDQVQILQPVAKVLVYMVSGQRNGDRESDWT